MNPRCSYMTLISMTTLVVCMTFLFHLLFSANQVPYITRNSEVSLNQISLAADTHASYHALLANIRTSDTKPHSRTLGVASHIYVLSLSRRVDRRKTMSSLARALDLSFEYVDGLEAADPRVDFALETVKRDRKAFKKKYTRNGVLMFPGFAFPVHSNRYAFDVNGNVSDIWAKNALPLLPSPSPSSAESTSGSIWNNGRSIHGKDFPLACATPEDPFPHMLGEIEISLLPPWRILSRGMVACWIAHLDIMHRIAHLQDEDAVAIVLEDDVDMEFDIESRLQGLWPALPHNNWDIVMLGYCHSDEMKHPPLDGAASLRPSSAPKCTHAYALSRVGARSLFEILSTPGFAYSRALDQAISWLVKTNEIRSFSVVPAVVVQSKRTQSDIWRSHGGTEGRVEELNGSGSEKGSKWRGTLVDSTLERVALLADRLGIAADA